MKWIGHGQTWFVILAALAGCMTLRVPAPEVQSYRLDYPAPEAVSEALPIVLRVAPFGINAVYDREAIVYRDNDFTVGTYYYHRWIANPATMIADLIARDLDASNEYRAVQRGGVVASDFDLAAEVDEFTEIVGTPCRARLSLNALVSRTRGPQAERIVLRRIYTEEEPCTGGDAADLVAAMSRALQRLSTQLRSDVRTAIHP